MVLLYDSLIILGWLMVASALALPFGETEKLALRDFWFTSWLVFVCFAYLAGCWHFFGMTVGMRAWRVKLVDTGGGQVSLFRCLLRFLTGFVSLGALGFGFIWALLDNKKRCWHDLAGHCILIRNPENPT